MDLSKKAYLSLGTNLGNKLSNLQRCINTIHTELAWVINVSPVYETPAWGFEAPSFYNCVIEISTALLPLELLKQIKELESKLGRTKKASQGYESRIIDIDIISYEDEIVNHEVLILPHKETINRKFVLIPLFDIAPNWIHIKTNQPITELLSTCQDTSEIEQVGFLELPEKPNFLSNLNYLVIEGNIGVGKTSLVSKISNDFNAKPILERFADNPFLPKFYEDQKRYAFSLEMSFLADRYQQLHNDLSQLDLFNDFLVADYHIVKSLLFAQKTLSGDEFNLYRSLFYIVCKDMPKPDVYVYLYQDVAQLQENIAKRGRSYEQNISDEYLIKIQESYLEFLRTQTDFPVLIIDVTHLDFVNNHKDYITLLEKI